MHLVVPTANKGLTRKGGQAGFGMITFSLDHASSQGLSGMEAYPASLYGCRAYETPIVESPEARDTGETVLQGF